jgi:hypothetical protein
MSKKKPNFRKKTKKQEVRLENSISKQNNKLIYDSFLEEYDNSTDNEIIELSKRLLTTIDQNNNDSELKYNALISIMQKRLVGNYKYNSHFSGYPDYEDPDFNAKISKKKEFYINKIPEKKTLKGHKSIIDFVNNKMDEKCKKSETDLENVFKLTQNQKFLKTFLSPNTPYNSMLLFHGTGVGKTCTSISIAEQYTEELKSQNKKIIILLNPSIKANFIKNIFNIQRVKQGIPKYQCTGDKYLNELDIENMDHINYKILEKKVKKIINGRYEFFGYQKFANQIENLQQKIKDTHPTKDHNRLIKKKIKDTFSNSVLIIDEVHNIKESDSLKVLPPLLNKIVKYSDNMKLLLLSATPMFDNSREIFFLINLMLKNDKKPEIYADDYMDSSGNLLPSKQIETNFMNTIKGYISYVRGEDPYRFPRRLYPLEQTIKIKYMPTKDSNDNVITDRIEKLQLVGCEMNGFQSKVYKKMESYGKKMGAFNQPEIMCSNIVFPKKDMDNVMDPKYKLGDFISNAGFSNIVKREKINGSIKYSIKHEEYNDFFTLKKIKNYSCKIASIIEHIPKSEGIIFIYSQYINSGLIPLALALEYMGYSKYNNSLIKDKVDNKGNYIIISGDNELSGNAYSDYLKIQDSNMNGEKVKIILGSETAAEGLDFSYIREVHILDPWFHLNKIEQVIGRGIRNCSHGNLDIDKRNVTIYMYASIKKINTSKTILDETIDLEIYRKAEIKSKQMSKIEYILKKSSIDCYLNSNGNKFETDTLYGLDGSKQCNYEKCDYKCSYELPKSINNLNYNTLALNETIINDNIYDIKQSIITLYKENHYYTLEDFINILKEDKLIMFFALNDIIKTKTKLINKHGDKGTLIYKNNYYIFTKNDGNLFITLNNIRKKSKKRFNSFNLSTIKTNTNNTNNNINNNIIDGKTVLTNYDENKIDIDTDNINFISNSKIEQINKNLKGKKINKRNISNHVGELNKIEKQKIIKHIKRYYLDFMPTIEKESLIQYLIQKSFNDPKKLSIKEKNIIKILYNILYFVNDVYYEDLSYKGNEGIWGYKIVNGNSLDYNKYDPKTNTFIKATSNEVKQINKSFKKKSILLEAPILGYYEVKMPQNKLVFKIRDKRGEGKKGSQTKTGSICDNDGMNKDKVINYIETIRSEKIYSNSKLKKPKKSILCKYLEIILRYKNEIDKSKKYFYGPEETIEYKLNKN